jgi:hypothetical protein
MPADCLDRSNAGEGFRCPSINCVEVAPTYYWGGARHHQRNGQSWQGERHSLAAEIFGDRDRSPPNAHVRSVSIRTTVPLCIYENHAPNQLSPKTPPRRYSSDMSASSMCSRLSPQYITRIAPPSNVNHYGRVREDLRANYNSRTRHDCRVNQEECYKTTICGYIFLPMPRRAREAHTRGIVDYLGRKCARIEPSPSTT